MKKFWFRMAVYLVSMVAVAWSNNAALLHFHPLAYYYTPMGMLLTAVVCCAETFVIWPVSKILFQHWILPSLKEGLEGEKKEIMFEELSKEPIVTEFEDD